MKYDTSEISILIMSYVYKRNASLTELCKVSGIGRTTLYKYFRHPSLWKLGSLVWIYDYLNIPKEERLYTTK